MKKEEEEERGGDEMKEPDGANKQKNLGTALLLFQMPSTNTHLPALTTQHHHPAPTTHTLLSNIFHLLLRRVGSVFVKRVGAVGALAKQQRQEEGQ